MSGLEFLKFKPNLETLGSWPYEANVLTVIAEENQDTTASHTAHTSKTTSPATSSNQDQDQGQGFYKQLVLLYRDYSRKWQAFAKAFLRLIFFIHAHIIYALAKIMLFIEAYKLAVLIASASPVYLFAIVFSAITLQFMEKYLKLNYSKQLIERANHILENTIKIASYVAVPRILGIAVLVLFNLLPIRTLLRVFQVPTIATYLAAGVVSMFWGDTINVGIEKFLKFMGLRRAEDPKEHTYARKAHQRTTEDTKSDITQCAGALGAYAAASAVGLPLNGLLVPVAVTAAGTMAAAQMLNAYNNYVAPEAKQQAASFTQPTVSAPEPEPAPAPSL